MFFVPTKNKGTSFFVWAESEKSTKKKRFKKKSNHRVPNSPIFVPTDKNISEGYIWLVLAFETNLGRTLFKKSMRWL
jgi:hypothetical protein